MLHCATVHVCLPIDLRLWRKMHLCADAVVTLVPNSCPKVRSESLLNPEVRCFTSSVNFQSPYSCRRVRWRGEADVAMYRAQPSSRLCTYALRTLRQRRNSCGVSRLSHTHATSATVATSRRSLCNTPKCTPFPCATVTPFRGGNPKSGNYHYVSSF